MSFDISVKYRDYSGFYVEESRFRELCESVTKYDFSAMDSDASLSMRDRDKFKNIIKTHHHKSYPMRIYSDIEGISRLGIVYVSCYGLEESKLPIIDESHKEWLEKIVSSSRNSGGDKEQVVVAAYAPSDEGDSVSEPEQVLLMGLGFEGKSEAPDGILGSTTYFCPQPPWKDDDVSLLYHAVVHARQISGCGSVEFLRFHATASISRLIDAVNACSAGNEIVSTIENLLGKANDVLRSASVKDAPGIFNKLSMEISGLIKNDIPLDAKYLYRNKFGKYDSALIAAEERAEYNRKKH